ncbi:MAG: hypothetical protein GF388_00360, partial [Candidatus Aegiribacteria sp.]|nr:hypothetical protein [Candidatus Aegiribacteria sp.]MBD3293896.1 hypothetical protein [Candidatus Fermentibacteria bacterium]
MMFDTESYFRKWNEETEEAYSKSPEQLESIIKRSGELPTHTRKYFQELAGFLQKLIELENSPDRFHTMTMEQLQKENDSLFAWIEPDRYDKTCADPAFAADVFGLEAGRLLSMLDYRIRSMVSPAFMGRRFQLLWAVNTLAGTLKYTENNGSTDAEGLRDFLAESLMSIGKKTQELRMLMSLDPEFRYYLDIASNCDSNDLRYLYRYGRRISKHELRTARFFSSYPARKLQELAGIMVDAYV